MPSTSNNGLYESSEKEKKDWDLTQINTEVQEVAKTDISNIDIDSLTDEQFMKIATRLKVLM